ncbi:MAG: FAD-binding oxidoreductase [Anderseniella sp.]
MKIGILPGDDNTNGWSRILPSRQPNPRLKQHIRADWLVIGAGYAGLAAARRLAENCPDQRIVVLEAGEAGENASGRNSGFAIDLPHNVGSSLDELEGARKYMGLARAAITHLENMVKAHDIKCDWAQTGKYHAAVSPRGTNEVLKPSSDALEASGEPFTWVRGEELRHKLGTSHFDAAVYTPGCILMNPAALTRGLADSLPENVELYEQSPVIEIDYANGITATTPAGSVFAPKMILAVNGLADQFGFHSGRLLRFAAHASLTRQLTQDEQKTYGAPRSWGLTPANAFAGITMRYTDDKRILIRQNIHFQPSLGVSDASRKAIAHDHKRLFDERFPMLADVSIEHTWTGYICLSENGAPGFGRQSGNVWTAVCQNAVGVTKGTISGLLVADLACAVDNPLIPDMESLGAPSRVPPRPFLDLGVRAKFGWEVFKNRHEA